LVDGWDLSQGSVWENQMVDKLEVWTVDLLDRKSVVLLADKMEWQKVALKGKWMGI